MRIEVRPLRPAGLVADYLKGAEAAAPFFPWRPHDPASYREKWDEVQERFDRPARERAAAAVTPSSPRAAERLRRFVEEGGAMVTTGQQAGLFTGPLYTVVKALSAVRLAAALEEELGIVVLPLFWCASEDHDWDEVNHVHAVDADGELRRIAVQATDRRPLPMSETRLGEDVETAFDAFADLVAGQGSNGTRLRSVGEAYSAGATMGEAFRRTMLELLAPFDALVTDAADPALKEASLPVLRRELGHGVDHARLVAGRSARLAAAGYDPQVAVVPHAANLFFHGAQGRERLHRDGDAWVAKDNGVRFAPGEAEAALEADPTAFSPNVLLRPVVESCVFPTLAYVGGPAETAYFAQAGALFDAFGVAPPVAFPRFSATVYPESADAVLRRWHLDPEELRHPAHEVVSRIARRRLPAGVEDALAALRAALVDGYAAVMDAARPVDPVLDRVVGSYRNRALLDAAEAERRILAQVKRGEAGLAREVAAARNVLFPGGVPQERVLNVFPFLAADPALLERMLAAMEIPWAFREAAGAGGGAAVAPAALRSP